MTSSKLSHPARYRVYQFFAALKAGLPVWAGGVRHGLSAEDQALVTTILKTPPQQQLFYHMPPNDRRHAVAVARALQHEGRTNESLSQAALLHDVGKSLSQPLIYRVLIVLFEAFWPGALQRLSCDPTGQLALDRIGWWRRPFVIHAHHPAIGADLAQAAGCDPLAVALIARHEASAADADELLAALQGADNLN